GYFSLLALSIYTALPSKYRRWKLFSLGVIFLASYLVLLSGSRAALVGIALLSVLLFVKEGFNFNASSIAFIMITLIVGSLVITESTFFQESLSSIQERNERRSASVPEYKVRGYDRILLYPEYLFIGSGDGLNSRFVGT